LIKLLEKGVGSVSNTTPMALNTALGVVYSKYTPTKLMEHITKNYKKINIPKLLISCQTGCLWAEMRFLYIHNDEFDSAIRVMMEHSVDAFDHLICLENITKVMNQDLLYKAISFYVAEVPSKVLDLLHTMSAKLDQERVARDAKMGGYLALIKKHLENIQEQNLKTVNESLNQLYVEEEDFAGLRSSITNHTALINLFWLKNSRITICWNLEELVLFCIK